MSRPVVKTATLALVACLCPAAAWLPGLPQEASDPEPPLQSDLVETSTSRLALIDITVNGDPQAIRELTPGDLKIRVNWNKVRDFQLDRFCPAAAGGDANAGDSAPGDGDPAGPVRGQAAPASYLLYFDQPHLTLSGRAQAMDTARHLVRELVRDGARAMVVSNAARLDVVQPFTGDMAELQAALDRLEGDRSQWDMHAEGETSRVQHVMELLDDDSSIFRAASAARSFQFQEAWLTDRSLRRLAITLSQMGDVDPPKAVLYFADAIRRNPGEHFLTFFGARHLERMPVLSMIGTDAFRAGSAFDRAINEAAAQGIRLYTVQPQGLVAPLDRVRPSLGATERALSVPHSSSVRYRDAQDTLANMAAESGGRAFLDGAPAERIVRQVREDFSCLYVASFDPAGLPLDAPLRVVVESRRPGVEVWTRGRIVLQSASTKLTSRLLGAFALDGTADGSTLRATLIPTGYDKGAFSGLLQVSVPGTSLPGATWELGASVVRRDQVRAEASGTVSPGQAGVAVVLEHELRLKPGAYEIVAVAHETSTGFVLSERVAVEWPDPDHGPASIGPIALVQPAAGAFLRGEQTRSAGSLVRRPAEPLVNDRPTALVAMVCRGRRGGPSLTVERSLIGADTVDFDPVSLAAGGERCAQLRDLVPAELVGAGFYRYEVRVRDGDRLLAEAGFDVMAVNPGPS